ncbi:MAG: hypothetical protein ACE5EF_10150 [Dehalococcoidia bacterium]
MRSSQIKLRFDDRSDLKRAWAKLPAAERTKIARQYARVLVKAAKVNPPGPKTSTEEPS